MPTKPNKLDGSNLRKFKTFGQTYSDSLVFPSDLEDQQYYPECIKFGIYERTGLDFERFGEAVVGSVRASLASDAKDENIQLEQQNASFNAAINSGNLSDKEKLETLNALSSNQNKIDLNNNRIKQSEGVNSLDVGKNALVAGVNNIESQNEKRLEQIRNPTSRLVQNIYLQMPESLIYNEQVDWQGSDLGIVGAFKEGQLSAGVIAGSLANAGKILGGAAGTVASIIPGIGTFAAGIIGTALGGETGLAGGLESTFNIKANPYKEQTFQGVPFRPFEFSFNFRPRNETEVIAMDDIIRSFRAFSKPTFKNAGQTGTFSYPHEFLIEFLTLKEDTYYRNEYIPQIKFCVCKSVNTNWTGQGWKSFRDGAPIDTTLTLSFEETEIITQSDVLGENNSVGDFASFGGYF